jgi:hypothetical protein
MKTLADLEMEVSALKTQLDTLRTEMDAALSVQRNAHDDSSERLVDCDSLVCRSLHLVDEKHEPQATFEIDEHGPALRLLDRAGRRRLTVRVHDGRGGLSILDEAANPIVQLFADADGHGQVAVSSPGGVTRAGLRAVDNGGVVSVLSPEGNPRAVMHSCDGVGEFSVFNDEHQLATMSATEAGGLIGTRDAAGRRANLLLTAEGGNTIIVYRPDGGEAVTILGTDGAGTVAVGSDDREDAMGAGVEIIALKNHGGMINVRDQDRKLMARVMATENGGELTLNSPDEKDRIKLEIVDGGGVLTTHHPASESTVRIAAAKAGASVATGQGKGKENRSLILKGGSTSTGMVIFDGGKIEAALGKSGTQETPFFLLNNPDQTPAVHLIAGAKGGVLSLNGPDGAPQVALGARENGGGVSVYNDLGVERGTLHSKDDGGLLQLKWGGTHGVVATATEKGGKVLIGDEHGKVIARLPDDDWPAEEDETEGTD